MAKVRDLARDLFNLGKGIGLNKPRVGHEKEFNLDRFKGALQEKNSLQRANRYVVSIIPPAWAVERARQDCERLIFFCDAVNIPGATINPVDHRRLGIGPLDRRPSNILPAEISASFMLDQNGRNLHFFQEWINSIFEIDPRTVLKEGNRGALFGEVHYHDYYATTIEISTYDVASNKIHTITCEECWPSLLGDVTLGWAQNDEFARVQVNFQVRTWHTNLAEGPGPGSQRALGGFERLIRLGPAGTSLLSSLKTPNNVGDAINTLNNAQSFFGALGGRT